MALIAGILSHRREGWRDARPPLPLLLAAAAVLALVTFAGTQEIHGLSGIPFVLAVACLVIFTLIGLPAVVFLLGRRAIIWLEPRLRVYGQLTDYLRVMWVPIGGFAVGYLTIIVLFAGFYGMLDRFLPGAFADAGGGLAEWLSFAFFTALGQDYTGRRPGLGECPGAGRRPPDPLGGLGTRVVRGGDVLHRAEAGPDRAAPRQGRRRMTGGPVERR